ncbi:MAG: gamma carbonic anhydrase family protein, partial [Candidatus Hodarchaeota archaeon]
VVHQSELGNHVLVGINAVIMDWVKIGDECIIGGGCVVPRKKIVESNSVVLGIPGKIVGKVSKEQKEYSWWATNLYQTLPKRYYETLRQL